MLPIDVDGLTQGALLETLAAEVPEREALVVPARGLRLTFAELDARSMALARGLVALGIHPGERVALWSDNRPDWIPLQFALARIGAVLVTANTALAKAEIGYLLRQSRSAAVIAAPGIKGREYVEALEALRHERHALPELRQVVVMEGEPGTGMRTLEDLERMGRLVPEALVRARAKRVQPHDAVNIQYTSGTTGFPKGATLSHQNVLQNAAAVAAVTRIDRSDRILLQVPLFHCFGCVIAVLTAYVNGCPLVAVQRFDPLAALEAMQAERVTRAYGVPTMFLAMLSHPEFPRFDLSALRGGIMAGTMCPEALMRRVIAEMGAQEMLVAYGLTEASPAITSSRPDDPVDIRCGTVGRALPGVDVRVVDPESGEDRPSGVPGELWARGPNVMLGYFEDEEATRRAITPDGWLCTGDLATLDERGLVRICGRIKELVIRGGENVYPAEVEDAIRAHPAVQDAAVFGVPSDELGEEVAAAVIAKPGRSIELAELGAFLEPRLARYKQPAHLHVLATFPMTPSGKVQKFKLRELLGYPEPAGASR